VGLLALARAAVELAEAEVAVGDKWTPAARPGERQRLTIVGLAALGVASRSISPSRRSRWRVSIVSTIRA